MIYVADLLAVALSALIGAAVGVRLERWWKRRERPMRPEVNYDAAVERMMRARRQLTETNTAPVAEA